MSEASSVTVYGFFGSFCTQKVYLALAEKGVRYGRRLVDIGPAMRNYEPWYARINPRMVIPTLQHGERIVCDSAVILRYIDANFEGPPLLPPDADARVEVEGWIDRIDALQIRELSYGALEGFMARLRDRVIMPRRLAKLRRHMRAAPELREVYEARIRDVEAWMRKLATPTQLDEARAQLDALLAELDAACARGPFVVGDSYTLADTMATVLSARMLLLKMAELSNYPHLLAHYRRMQARPDFPREDIIDHMSLGRKLRIAGPVLLPRLALAEALVAALTWALLTWLN